VEQPTAENNLLDRIMTRENLYMLIAFAVIIVITAILANQTSNYTLEVETAQDVPGDVEDISDEVFEALEIVQTAGNSIATELEDMDDLSDSDALVDAIASVIEEDAIGFIDTVYVADDSTVAALDLSTAETTDDITSGETEATVPTDETTWSVTETGIQYIPEATGIDVWVTTSQVTLNSVLAEGAAAEDLFAGTEDGYLLVVTPDDQVVAQFNRETTSADAVAGLQSGLTEDNYNEDDEYYSLDSDPILDEASYLARQTSEINDWVIIGSYPQSEVPTQNIFESTATLFDVTEVGSTVSFVVERAVEFLNEDIGWLFRGMRWPIEQVINLIEGAMLATHWSIILLGTAIVALLSGGRRVAYIATISMFLIGLLGLWELTITTLAMLLTSMAFCVVVGIPLGIWSARSDRVNDIVRAVLDAMQTIHPFVYLVPIVVLFGIGKVPGTIATIIFALPPMVRLTNLGIRQVPEDVIEAGKAFGSSDWQLLRNVQIPLALPSIMAGVNQTLMLSLSMVVIVALIAGGGLGQEIFRAIGRADTGRAVVAGVAVLLLAVAVDRISQGQTLSQQDEA